MCGGNKKETKGTENPPAEPPLAEPFPESGEPPSAAPIEGASGEAPQGSNSAVKGTGSQKNASKAASQGPTIVLTPNKGGGGMAGQDAPSKGAESKVPMPSLALSKEAKGTGSKAASKVVKVQGSSSRSMKKSL